ncbi:uncharacterized protein Z518_00550 [Rhinocladiella mackenziei CBS 650.93]|uniref:Uncharacterized protein n=1 Tax=Rhinocladiella mackenziei CBS 650.93 TaxID=1442369 RepID=A0A0D2JJ92_9EURO|nr:uncharacterized protein Z518_00550 [Rhinocladiella mackenziei CBS 650.93]KIX09470.1 hypothetical protein Z518_00550 [Rhinocladiella mackenziei CBS 650.93]
MGPSAQTAGQKRKIAPNGPTQSSSARKRQKNQDARAIPVQRMNAATSANGELNISSFIKAREFEITALEKSMQKARKTLTTRAFQQVPRHMRRRTASHNAKKVPRRLRRRAEREMKEDNTPTVTRRTRTPSRKLRLRLETAKTIRKLNKTAKTVRQRKREAKSNAKQSDPVHHVSVSRIPRLKKNQLARPPTATTKYKKRQLNKTWLPTHLWHAKRAHMTRPTEPLWRIAIPLSPTEKSYRPSHRAAGTHGCVAWDTSYMSTVACWGTETAIESILGAFGFTPQGLSGSLLKRWRSGTRFGGGWIYEPDNHQRAIAPVVVIWCMQPKNETAGAKIVDAAEQMDVDADGRPQPSKTQTQTKRKKKLDTQILIRIHPSAFHQFWQELLKIAKMQKPQVLVEDLRFEVGSIEIKGPGSTEALLGVLRPFPTDTEAEQSIESVWTSLVGLSNPGILPQNAILALDVVDPRLRHPPKQIDIPQSSDTSRMDEILVSWPPDEHLSRSRLTSHKTRWQVCHALPSQKAINRRKSLSPPGQAPALSTKDPRIPVILLAARAEDRSASETDNSQGTWIVLLPWKCVDPVWRSLMYYPLSNGGTPRFGGLQEKRQLEFEQARPWFPGDLPGTEAGKAWERAESEKRFDDWIRRPPKHRVAWDKIDLGLGRCGEVGRGWACDWEYLFESTEELVHHESASGSQKATDHPTATEAKPALTQRQRKAMKAQADAEARKDDDPLCRRNTSSPESEGEEENQIPTLNPTTDYQQLSPTASLSLMKDPLISIARLPSIPALMTIRITLLDKGTPRPAARIYRLPSIPKRPPPKPVEQSATANEILPSTPPPAQKPRPPSSIDSSPSSPSKSARDLRARWLALQPPWNKSNWPHIASNYRYSKQKTSRFDLPCQQQAHPRESLANINVLPKNAPKEIIDKYGPNSAFGRGDGEIPKERPAPKTQAKGKGKKKGKGTIVVDSKSADKNVAYLDPNDYEHTNIAALTNPFDSPSEWSKHPPCPNAHDLIGFVTSGGYNLSEGRGTAIGSIWAQRVLEWWNMHESHNDTVGDREGKRERMLCIVRNTGESIGRLGIWEVCA